MRTSPCSCHGTAGAARRTGSAAPRQAASDPREQKTLKPTLRPRPGPTQCQWWRGIMIVAEPLLCWPRHNRVCPARAEVTFYHSHGRTFCPCHCQVGFCFPPGHVTAVTFDVPWHCSRPGSGPGFFFANNNGCSLRAYQQIFTGCTRFLGRPYSDLKLLVSVRSRTHTIQIIETNLFR